MDFHLFLSLKQCFFKNKCLVHQQFLDHFVVDSFFPTRFMFSLRFPLFKKKDFTVFQKSVLSFTKVGFKLLKNVFPIFL